MWKTAARADGKVIYCPMEKNKAFPTGQQTTFPQPRIQVQFAHIPTTPTAVTTDPTKNRDKGSLNSVHPLILIHKP